MARKYLTQSEIDLLLTAAKKHGRERERNHCMILMGFRHGLRCTELVSMEWEQVLWADKSLDVQRVKNGKPSVHPLEPDEIKALRKLEKSKADNRYVFASEHGGHVSERQFRTLLLEIGKRAGLEGTHPHQLRHACGYAMANGGVDTRTIQNYLGHRSISSTVIYTELSVNQFKGLSSVWKK